MKKLLLSAFTIIFFTSVSFGQANVADTTVAMSLFQFHGGLHVPQGDIANRFGTNAAVGFSFAYKTNKNILLGADFTFLFGDNVKNEESIAKNLQMANGQFLGFEGHYIQYLLQERGFTTGFYVGKIFPIFGPNPNSGLVVRLGAKYMEYKTHIETRNDVYPPFEDEYLKGYDRKVGGLAAHEFIGYQHFSNNHFANFYIGIDIYQGFTTDYRTYSIDLMQETNNNYFDLLYGFEVGWVIPVYKRSADKFYID